MKALRGIMIPIVVCIPVSTYAQEYPWTTQNQSKSSMDLGAALANAIQCGLIPDQFKIEDFIKDKIAPKGELTPAMAASLLITATMIGKYVPYVTGGYPKSESLLAKQCAEVLAAFGPNGTVFKDILKSPNKFP